MWGEVMEKKCGRCKVPWQKEALLWWLTGSKEQLVGTVATVTAWTVLPLNDVVLVSVLDWRFGV